MHGENDSSRGSKSVKHMQHLTGKTHLEILTLNVCGLNSKLISPEFMSLINQYDIIGVQETKTDDTDTFIEIPGYKLFYHNRNCLSRYRSGGIALIVKENLLPYIKVDQSRPSKLILFFTISKVIYGFESHDDDLVCGIVYIPPQGSKYASDDPYLEIQEDIFRYCSDLKHVLLFGDFNSRCKKLPDFVKFDEYISDVHGLQQLYDENVNVLNYFERYDVPLDRNSADDTANSYGYSLLELCRNNNLFILNGRIGTDYTNPSPTCKNKSTVDYFISSAYVLPNIKDFNICEFSPLFSDVHCPVSLTIDIEHESEFNLPIHTKDEKIPKLWDPDKSDVFIDNIDILQVSDIEMQLDKILDKSTVTKGDIDEVVLKIGSLFDSSCKETFGFKHVNTENKSSRFKPWFNAQCTQARNVYHKTRRAYNKHKTSYYRNILKNVSKNYKNTLATHSKRFANDRIKRLRSLKNSNPREYWKIINAKKKSGQVEAPLSELYEFYKSVNDLNSDENTNYNDETENNSNNSDMSDDIENEVNQPITESEILQTVKLLKNNKSPGDDYVVNEHIKTTVHILLPVYVKLFNLILDTGIIPDSWTLGIIKPIYKNKGDPKLPENYRPITLLSCFGKLFTSIINNRLNKYAEKHDVIDWAQAGFRKKYSTSDNLFILKSLIDIIQSQHKKILSSPSIKSCIVALWISSRRLILSGE